MLSEAVRERDLQRYYRPWLDAQNLVNAGDGRSKGLTYEGYQAKGSHDKSLTAFAQLAALRLDARRCMVSLIDSKHQYILAEATRTLSLCTQSPEVKEDEVWLGHSVIAKSDGVCQHCFSSTYTTVEDNGEEFIAEALVVPDCREDPRFATRDYVVAEPGVRFYAGVPITSKSGHRIGVYGISDERPRDGLRAADVRFLQDVAAAVMEHLDLMASKDARNAGERMVRGLTEFIERSSLHDSNSPGGRRPTTLEKQTENARLEAIADEESAAGAMPATSKQPQPQPQHKRVSDREADTSRIFQRAARIIRQSTHADGVVFFDTSAAHVGKAYEDPTPAASSDENSCSSTTAGSATASRQRSLRRARSTKQTVADNGLSESVDALPCAESKPCPVAGLSRRTSTLGVTEADFVFTEANMERYITRYPHGKFFNFDAEGTGINSSDEKSERSEPEHIDKAAQIANATRRLRKGKDRFIPTEFLKILPNVRSLIFLPLWDPASERWAAGGFIWTTATGRLLNPEDELPYLKAFGNSITSEVARWNAQKADRAKTTFIASISHELRSPLHGILGSVEFLRDAVSSSYQQSLVASIETCGKTLLDTIDHVLDYAKINKLRSASIRKKQRGEGRTRRVPADNSILGVTTVFNLAQLVEEVCDTVCAGHTFRRKHDDHNAIFHDQGNRSRAGIKIVEQRSGSDSTPAAAAAKQKDRVVVTLNVASFQPWIVRSQPGALRRVVMNLLGNALKYTEAGFITVSLTQNEERSNSQAVEFDISVEDSGRGMSTEYQHTKIFAAFSQEDPFSNGTGLGLSIVKQIVDSMKGQVDVQSTVNVGTKISVSLRLPAGTVDQARTNPFPTGSPNEFKDKVASIVFPSISHGGAGEKLRQSMSLLCQGFYIKTYDDFDLPTTRPNFLITEPDSLLDILGKDIESHHPLAVICVCTDPAEKTATEARIRHQNPYHPWAIEVTTQPCGPRKLAQLLLDGQSQASQKIQNVQMRPAEPSPAPSPDLGPPSDPHLTVHRSISDLIRGANAVPSSISSSHSPLISANMPGAFISPITSPLLPSQPPFPTTPTSPNISSPSAYFPIINPRVLLVDDNAINLKLLVVFAQRQKLDYASSTNGLEALNLYKERALSTDPPTKPFDFILMDLSMPVMGGLESTRLIRGFETEKELQRSAIVALTGLASAQDQQDAFDAGVDEYLVKPVKFADVRRVFGTK